MEDIIGQNLLGRYRVEEFIGRGGMAEVYRAQDTRRRITVALKFLREDMAEDEVFLRRFRREAKVLQKLQHPNIVRYYGFEESDNLHFLVVEFINGEGLRKKLSRLSRPLTLGQALSILEPVCNALHFAHAEGIYHCDIKPANVMIDSAGRVVVADFGIAKLAEGATLTYGTTGTPAYMAPEQCRGQSVDARTDIYSLAITTFEVLTLDRPFTGDIATIQGAVSERIRWEQLRATPPSPRKYNPQIPVWAESAILKALEKPRNKRFSSVLAFYSAMSDGGKSIPDAILPWAEGDSPDSIMPTLMEPSTPHGSTRSGRWEQRVTDAMWAARRGIRSASDAVRAIGGRARLAAAARALGGLLTKAKGLLGFMKRRLRVPGPAILTRAVIAILVLASLALAVWKAIPALSPAQTSTPASTPVAVFATVEARVANIRSGPASVYPVIATAASGDRFQILARTPQNDWFQVCCQEGKSGWIHSDLLGLDGDAGTLPVFTPSPPPPQQIGATPSR